MEKAYDLKALGEKLKAQGLPVLEDTAEKVYKATKEWAQESAIISKNKIDDVVAPFYDQLDKLVLPQIDKIDGVEGN